MQLDEADLSNRSKERLRPYHEQKLLSYEVLRANVGIDPDRQLALAQDIASSLQRIYEMLFWSDQPSWNQLLFVCELIWKHFDGSRIGAGSVSNPRQLAALINRLRARPTMQQMILNQMPYSDDADKAVGKVLDFLKLWANFQFPRLLRAVDRVQRHVIQSAALPAGNYEQFASQVENLFLEPALIALDEYGIPIQLARKLSPFLKPLGNLDEVLVRLRDLPLDEIALDPFEYEVLYDAQQTI